MKSLLLFTISVLLTFSFKAEASHAAGGTLWYEYIGDSTGIPFHYQVNYEFLRRNEPGSATIGSSVPINISSPCYNSMSIQLQRQVPPAGSASGDGGFVPEPKTNCSSGSKTDPSWMNISIHRYEGTVVLPGKCGDYLFTYSLCCLNSNIDNIQMPSSNNIYIDARLNNILGPNTSPKFEVSPVVSYCVNKVSTTYHSAVEPDGDSLYYNLANPLNALNTPIQYNQHFSKTQPISTQGGVYFDNILGIMSFIPTTIENAVVKIKVREYRIDTATQAYVFVGVTSRQLQYQIVSTCDTVRLDWTISEDSLGIGGTIVPDCLDSIVKFKTKFAFVKASLAADGSDFEIMDRDAGNIPIPIIRAGTNNNSSSVFADEVWLYLNQPIHHDGKYTITTRMGTDSNTVLNICGTGLPEGDTVSFNVTDCQSGFGIDEHKANSINIYPSPANDFVTVKLPLSESLSNWSYAIYSLQGQKVLDGDFKKNTNGGQSIKVETLAKGLYTLKITSNMNTTYSAKFVKN